MTHTDPRPDACGGVPSSPLSTTVHGKGLSAQRGTPDRRRNRARRTDPTPRSEISGLHTFGWMATGLPTAAGVDGGGQGDELDPVTRAGAQGSAVVMARLAPPEGDGPIAGAARAAATERGCRAPRATSGKVDHRGGTAQHARSVPSKQGHLRKILQVPGMRIGTSPCLVEVLPAIAYQRVAAQGLRLVEGDVARIRRRSPVPALAAPRPADPTRRPDPRTT